MDSQESMKCIKENELLHLQLNLSLLLATTNDIDEGIRLCLDSAMQTAAMQSGIIFLFDRTQHKIIHYAHCGLDDDWLENMIDIGPFAETGDGSNTSNDHQCPHKICQAMSQRFRDAHTLSIFNNDKLLGCMNLASNNNQLIPPTVHVYLKTLAASMGNAIARVLEHQELLKTRMQKNEKLKQLNTTLNTLLEKREMDRLELEETVNYNIKEMILPYIGKIRSTGSAAKRRKLLDVVEITLNDVSSRFMYSLTTAQLGLTPAEIKVATFIKQGKSTKEIAELMGSSEKTVKNQRLSIRKKIGISNRKVNLRAYLQSLKLSERP